MDMPQLTQEQLAALLRQAERAHGEYEAQLGRRDDDWPDWYAAFILAQLQREQGETDRAPHPST